MKVQGGYDATTIAFAITPPLFRITPIGGHRLRQSSLLSHRRQHTDESGDATGDFIDRLPGLTTPSGTALPEGISEEEAIVMIVRWVALQARMPCVERTFVSLEASFPLCRGLRPQAPALACWQKTGTIALKNGVNRQTVRRATELLSEHDLAEPRQRRVASGHCRDCGAELPEDEIGRYVRCESYRDILAGQVRKTRTRGSEK